MEAPFVVVDGTEFFLGSWVNDDQLAGINEPSVVVNVFEDLLEKYVIVRSPLMMHEIISLPEFIERVKTGRFVNVVKPKFLLGQELKNKYTEETLTIKDVPHRVNDTGKEYVYYVVVFTPTFGHNFDCKTESEIEKFYASEGVVMV